LAGDGAVEGLGLLAGTVGVALDDVRGAAVVTGGRGDTARGAVCDRVVEAGGGVVDALDDVRGTAVVTGGCWDTSRGAAGDRADEPGNASFPTASPAPKTISAVNAIAVRAPAVRRRRSTRGVAASVRGSAAW
jgi:hypothetical protein